MLHAQMPEPLPPTERPPVQEPTEPPTPIEDPAPGEAVPEIPIPERLARGAAALLAGALLLTPITVAAQTSQSAVPVPLPPAARPDTPGGSTRDGVARPPGINDGGINRGTPPQTESAMPVIPPPGTASSPAPVTPK